MSCAALVNSQHGKEVAGNRKYLKFIIETVHVLAKQGIPFRGHDEDDKTSKNLGNFKELIKFHCRHIPYLNEYSESKIAVYTSPKIQNEIIHLIAKQIINIYLPNQYYSIICDETMDLSRKEMLELCIRQVDDSFNVHEKFFGFFRTIIRWNFQVN